MTLFQFFILSLVAFVIGVGGVAVTYSHAGSKHAIFAILAVVGSAGLMVSFVWFIIWIIGLIF